MTRPRASGSNGSGEGELQFRAHAADHGFQSIAARGFAARHVSNCACPFSATTPAFVEACIGRNVHYLDITGEVPVFPRCHAQDRCARAASVMLCPSACFDIVPTDCLAARLKEKLPDADRIDIAFSFCTRPSIGTIKTEIEGAAGGGLVSENHRLATTPQAHAIRRIPFRGKTGWAVSFPGGEVFTSGIPTGVPSGMVF